ncbi:peptide ABC transporter substrate-binding protein [Bifidobacterium dolichotidis]|uniref:Peptide ABC transporter substrate-binding protein n=1 Tax=Bifidobacterium dolichotidis TaxID=2306976 RepID=A0A430FPR8_9BIFI|nr:transcriptional repressor [Bifidobacterium dolichotidis]RSX54818.1 peptide ABC transporter substrate-binding protein [Bifidobacterium dolichotidis]
MVQRQTKQRDALLAQMRKNDRFISAQILHQQLLQEGEKIGLATVYRQLNSLVQEGAADTVRLGDEQLFRLCRGNGHHHHIICRNCGRTVEIEPPSDAWLGTIAQKTGYTIESHTFEVFGLCPSCQKA